MYVGIRLSTGPQVNVGSFLCAKTDTIKLKQGKEFTFQFKFINLKSENNLVNLRLSNGTTIVKEFEFNINECERLELVEEKQEYLAYVTWKSTTSADVTISIGRYLDSFDSIDTSVLDIRHTQVKETANLTAWEDNYLTLLESTVKAETELEQLKDIISLKASKEEINEFSESLKETEMKLTPDGLSIIIKNTGGTNLIKNSIFKNEYKFWEKTGGNNIWRSQRGIQIWGELKTSSWVVQKITDIPYNTKVISFSGEFASLNYVKGTTNCLTGLKADIVLTDDTMISKMLIAVDENTGYAWNYKTYTLKTDKNIKEIRIGFYGRDFEGKIYCQNLMCNIGIMPQQWSQSPDELYDGITTIDRDGITVLNGGLTIKNKNQQIVFQGDVNGNLDLISRDVDRSISFKQGAILQYKGNTKSVGIENNTISLYDFNGTGNWCSSYLSLRDNIQNQFGSGIATGRAAHFYNLLSVYIGDNIYRPYVTYDRLEDRIKLYDMKAFNINYTDLENVKKINFNTEDKMIWLGKMTLYNNTIDTNSGTNKLWLNYWRGAGSGTSTVHICDGNNNGTGGKLTAGSLQVTGSKNCVINTLETGNLLVNAYETTDYYFGDLGSGYIENGECYIYIDPIFQKTINSKYKYQVFLTKYGKGEIWVEERNENYFLVKGTADIEFGWEIKAKRKGYENDRLEKAENDRDVLNGHGFNNNGMNEINSYNEEFEKLIDKEFRSNTELTQYAHEDNIEYMLKEIEKEEERILYNNLMFKGEI